MRHRGRFKGSALVPFPPSKATKAQAREGSLDIFTEIGSTGLKRSGSFLQAEFVHNLRGQRGQEQWTEFEANCAIANAGIRIIKTIAKKAPWDFEGEHAEFVKECWEDQSCSTSHVVDGMLTMLTAGFALMETVYKVRNGRDATAMSPGSASKYSDGRIGWRKIELRAADTITEWLFDDENGGGLRGAVQQAAPDWRRVELPLSKCLLLRLTAPNNSPEGQSLLRGAYWEYYGMKRLQEVALIAAERWGVGFPVARIPGKHLATDASAGDQAIAESWRNVVTNMRADEQAAIVIPSDHGEDGKPLYDLTLLTAGGERVMDLNTMVIRCETRIAQVLLADFLMLGHEGVGARNLGDSKVDLFTASLESILGSIADTMTRHAIPRLLALNGLNAGDTRMVHGSLSTKDVQSALATITALAQTGDLPGESTIRELYANAGLDANNRDLDRRFPDEPEDPEVAEAVKRRKAKPKTKRVVLWRGGGPVVSTSARKRKCEVCGKTPARCDCP